MHGVRRRGSAALPRVSHRVHSRTAAAAASDAPERSARRGLSASSPARSRTSWPASCAQRRTRSSIWTPRDVGIFYHKALETFARENAARLNAMSADEAADAMDRVTAGLLAGLRTAPRRKLRASKGGASASSPSPAARPGRWWATFQQQVPARWRWRVDFGREDGRILLKDVPLSGRHRPRGRMAGRRGEVSARHRLQDARQSGEPLGGLLRAAAAAGFVPCGGGGEWAKKPAGIFYFAVDVPLIKTPSRDPAEVEALRRRRLSRTGWRFMTSACSPP